MAWIKGRLGWVCAGAAFALTVACGSSSGNGLLGGGDGGPDAAGGTGGSAGSGGAAGAGGAKPVSCSNSLDCVDTNGVCDPATKTCVECLGDNDCTNQVCDPVAKRCVDCRTTADCSADQACIGGTCVTKTPCQSDNTCTPLGKLCDKQLGYCVDCVHDTDCPDGKYCASGACQPDVCTPGQGSCIGNSRQLCNASGSGYDPASACPTQTTCVASGGSATCSPWVCQAGQTACDQDMLTVCADDGLSVKSTQDCTKTGKHCVAGQCSTLVCTPSTTYCKGDSVMQCNGTGTSESVVQTCSPSGYCDDATSSCQPLLCTPNQPACDGTIATTCNTTGKGYLAGGTDCALSGKACDSGVCSTCPGGAGAVDKLRFKEVHTYADYVVIENTSANCSADLAGVTLYGDSTLAGTTTSSAFTVNFTTRTLAPGETATVVDSVANSGPPLVTGDITSATNLPFSDVTGAFMILCQGSTCTPASSTSVVDLWASTGSSGDAPPAYSSSITFSPNPIPAIPSANQITQSYLRTAYAGKNPSFLASDWTVGAATRPY